MNATAQIDFVIAAPFDVRIGDAWRISMQDITDCIRFVRQYRKVIAERDEMLTATIRLHKPSYVEHCEKLLPWTLSLYLEHVRNILQCEAKMDAIGMAYARSSDAWEAA
jgi:hypothetical protein